MLRLRKIQCKICGEKVENPKGEHCYLTSHLRDKHPDISGEAWENYDYVLVEDGYSPKAVFDQKIVVYVYDNVSIRLPEVESVEELLGEYKEFKQQKEEGEKLVALLEQNGWKEVWSNEGDYDWERCYVGFGKRTSRGKAVAELQRLGLEKTVVFKEEFG